MAPEDGAVAAAEGTTEANESGGVDATAGVDMAFEDEAVTAAVGATEANEGGGTHAAPRLNKRRRAKKRHESYKIFLHKVLKKAHPKLSISTKAMSIMNSFVVDTFEKLASEAERLARRKKKQTIGPREISTAVQLVLPGKLAKHASVAGAKAVANIGGAKAVKKATDGKIHQGMNLKFIRYDVEEDRSLYMLENITTP